MTSAEEQLETLCRGVVDVHVRAELLERLRTKKRLRVKAGFDPTRPDLHLGHTVLMQKMRQFQELGHEVVFLVGDFTAMIGDPTGKSELRPRLTREEVRAAAETYQTQAFKVLDKDKTTVLYNSEWLDKMSLADLIDLGAKYTVARMIERRDFKQRLEEQRDIYMHELLYPLAQGYDSVALKCDVELGGTDQLFNLLVGRRLMPRYDLPAQIVMTTPILEGLNARVEDGKVVGAKMSKSANNYVGIDEPPLAMLNKLMLVDDGVIWRYFELLSAKSNQEIAALRAAVDGGTSIVKVKEEFAIEIVTRFHSAQAAQKALDDRRQIAAGIADMTAPTHSVEIEGANVSLAKALSSARRIDDGSTALAGYGGDAILCKSTSEAVRLIKGGAIRVEGAKATLDYPPLELDKEYVVRIGSKNQVFARLKIVKK